MQAGPSSQGSTEPWDTTFNRAMNVYRERDKSAPPRSAGRVTGFGTSMKFTEYLMSTCASILVDSVGPPRAEVCRTAASFP